MLLAQASLRYAISQLGVKEEPIGSNGGPQVTQYLKSVGLGAGHPWCMAFVYWNVNKACADLNLKNPLLRTGHVLHQYNNTSCKRIPARSSAVKPGDIFIMKIGSKGAGHTGFIEEVKNGYFITIEGNTNDEGSREGYEVCRRQRSISSIHAIIQLP
ncbi:CHAP domain-containing protein [Lacibacter luteus]|uniref:CHAP domain-containing protein n=1 Tax=Lacibacter luteus TaxID=2508719 RepID=A0A4Q1CDE2_9BACT|nr:CHAP domain-containing protein [Lacibacter luteus]RXK57565.1 CHAP domain-containing protein [Lacibacter luteus]